MYLNRSFRFLNAFVVLLLGPGLLLFNLTYASTVPSTTSYLPVVAVPPSNAPTPTVVPSPPSGVRVPNDPWYHDRQWNLLNIRASEAWSISTNGGVILAIIDTGVDHTHPDLHGRFVDRALWWDFANSDNDPMDINGHGTHVAGIAAAASDNGVGVTGVAWGARIMPLKVLGDDGRGYTSWTALAVRHAVDHGARVINLSLGGISQSSSLSDAIRYAREHDVVVVAAAGNCHQGAQKSSCGYTNDPVTYPAAYEGVIAVAATTRSNEHAPYSNAGYYVDVAAPGGDSSSTSTYVYSTVPRGFYAGLSGTSMAAPHVAGLATLILDEVPWLPPQQVESIIVDTTVDLGAAGRDDYFGKGLIDMRRALEVAWYVKYGASAVQEAAQVTSDKEDVGQERIRASATDCMEPHAEDRVLLLKSPHGGVARQFVPAAREGTVKMELGAWQVLQVPDGQACAVMQALNDRGNGNIAELDLLIELE